ncbi:MAG: type II toxin-antitoxin system VapC family toxin [Deferrisomatales bacterium]|nr:type II toxin-antitoxin system VapC family toxin [Deferrisomatales bacterium]
MFLLDTNTCIRILNNSSETVVKRLREVPPSRVHLCSVVKAELWYGARNSARVEQNLALLERFFQPLSGLPLDDACAEVASSIRATLNRQGTPIGPNDLLIAAIARVNDLTLVTHNTGEFSRVPGLRWVDWEA